MNTLQNTKSLRAAGTGRSQRSHGQRSCSSPIPFQSTRAQPKGGACRPAPQPRIVVPQAVRSDAATESLDAATLQLISDITRSVEASVSAATAASAQQGEQVGLTGSSESIALRAKVVAAIQRLSKGLLERETEVCQRMM